jgi:hypothetical protein
MKNVFKVKNGCMDGKSQMKLMVYFVSGKALKKTFLS